MDADCQLWAAVIVNAIEDARGTVTGVGNATSRHAEMRHARNWLTRPNRDFNTVCHLAGLDPVAVRERCQRMFPRTDEIEDA